MFSLVQSLSESQGKVHACTHVRTCVCVRACANESEKQKETLQGVQLWQLYIQKDTQTHNLKEDTTAPPCLRDQI